jgi:hypothetical protein
MEEELNTYVSKVRHNTQQYMQALISENANLLAVISTLENEKELYREEARKLRDELERQKNQEGYLQRRLVARSPRCTRYHAGNHY